MNPNQPPNRMIKFKSGLIQEVVAYIKLIIRLMGDPRVNPLIKLIPLGTLVYTLWPIDIPGPIDDAAFIGLGAYLFIELCPPEVVEEHRQAILAQAKRAQSRQVSSRSKDFSPNDIIDAEFWEDKTQDSKKDDQS